MSVDDSAIIQAAGESLAGTYDEWSRWYELSDGRAFRCTLEPDNDTRIEDFEDCYGTFHWGDSADTRSRPKGCDGAARKLLTREGYIWWQPFPDFAKEEPDNQNKIAERVADYWLEGWSYCGVVVEVRGIACPCCHERKEVTESLWGIETDAGDYFGEVVTDLVARAK